MLTLTRIDNWQITFQEALKSVRNNIDTFSWDPKQPNTLHCLTFSNYMVCSVTGMDIYGKMASQLDYADPKSALVALKGLGFENLDQLIGSLLPEAPLDYITQGDLILVPSRENPNSALYLMVAVADPPYYWVVSSDHGLSRGLLKDAVKGFSVG